MSRTPSGGVSATSKTPTSRLAVPPTIRSSPSLSNLHIHSHIVESSAAPPVPPLPNQVLDSTASSVINLDMNEGILLQDVDVETEDAEDINVMSLDSDMDKGDGNSKKILRDQLRKTLSHKASNSGSVVCLPVIIGAYGLPQTFRPLALSSRDSCKSSMTFLSKLVLILIHISIDLLSWF